jgi:hypothetical protein
LCCRWDDEMKSQISSLNHAVFIPTLPHLPSPVQFRKPHEVTVDTKLEWSQ